MLPSKTFLIPLVLAGSLLASGCVAVAAGGAGYLISREVLPNDVYSAHLTSDVEDVWRVARQTLEDMHDLGSEVQVTETPRVAEGKVNGASVRIEVEAYDIDRSIVRVSAKTPLTSEGATAEIVLDKIVDNLGE